MVGLVFTLYASVLPYNQVVSKMMIVNSKVDETTAGQLFGIISIIAAIVCPVASVIADKFKMRLYFSKLNFKANQYSNNLSSSILYC